MMPYFCVLKRSRIIRPNWLFGQASSERCKAQNDEDFFMRIKKLFLGNWSVSCHFCNFKEIPTPRFLAQN